MHVIRNSETWSAFDEVFCLTLEGDTERQQHAAAELCAVGLYGFKFIEGVSAHSREVQEAYDRGDVQLFPPCFRCGKLECGEQDCNNTLISQQVACYLSFMHGFMHAYPVNTDTYHMW